MAEEDVEPAGGEEEAGVAASETDVSGAAGGEEEAGAAASETDVSGAAGGEEEAGAAASETDVSDLPLDESPEAHIRRAMADTGAGEGEAASEPEPAGDAEEAAE
jgi:hypothetical protein